MLKGSNLQFTNATYFNDPFDCHPKLIDCTNVPESKSGWPPADFIRDKNENQLENLRNRAWISCLSKTFDNLLMWAYYSNHNGVCIGIDRAQLAKRLNGNLGLMVFGSDVEYKDIINRPDYSNSFENLFQYQLCTKGLQWKHEQEVRYAIIEPFPWIPYALNRKPKKQEIIDWKEVRFYPQIGPSCFHSIYLGCKIKEKEKATILDIIRSSYPEISVYQMYVNPDKFKLDAQPQSI